MAVTTDRLISVREQYADGMSKSPEARMAQLQTYRDLEGPAARPFGSQRDENFGMPRNYTPPPARIFVVNHSRTRPWKRLTIPVSATRGADERLMSDRELAKRYTADALYREVAQGRDMNGYAEGIQPVNWQVRIPGGPNGRGGSIEGRFRVIPSSPSESIEPVRIEVPEGTWDLYLGNYDRMRGYENADARFDRNGESLPPDQKVIQEEKQRLGAYWRRRHNPVFQYNDDGQIEDLHNPFGCLEFIRETVVAMREPLDQAYLTSLDLVEAI